MTNPDRNGSLPFMVVATFRPDTDFAALQDVLPDEERQIALLRSQGRMGAVHMSFARRTAFAEILATDEEHVAETVATLPLSRFVDIDIYPTLPPAPPTAAGRA